MQKQRLSEIPPGKLPPSKRTASRYSRRMRTFIYIFLLFALLVGGALAYGYSYFESTIQAPLVKFFHPVSRGNNEPPPDYSAITGRPWNILLLGSDNDNKYSFPALLTQVMMVVHVDPDNSSVYMISIPRDSWVYMSLNGGMHKIDQAFLFGAAPHNSFDDGVRAARQTVEQDYGITIDRYAWVGLSGFASVIDTLGGVDIDVTHPIVDDTYPDDTRANPNDPFAVKRLYLAPGPQHLNGLEALEYVRSRHADLVGDIGRTNR
ncbi:MAG TPA: LCP family protein, partial [Ktedonobacteraceae bacterium]|nr:LCP family protein [Ktedonobacteraceae bacterium]